MAFKRDKMNFNSGSRSHEFISFRLGKEMGGQPNPKSTEVIESESQQIEQIPEPEVAERPVDTRSLVQLSSTSDTESCGAYFTRKMESLGAEEQIPAESLCRQVFISKEIRIVPSKKHVPEDR